MNKDVKINRMLDFISIMRLKYPQLEIRQHTKKEKDIIREGFELKLNSERLGIIYSLKTKDDVFSLSLPEQEVIRIDDNAKFMVALDMIPRYPDD